MNSLSRYMSWRLAQSVSLSLFLLTALALAFDLMQEWDDVVRTTRVSIMPVLLYAGLRLPEILAESLPIAATLGGIILLGMLMRNNELVAAWAGGASTTRMMLGLLPVGIVLMAFQFALNDRLVPYSLAELYDRQVGDYQRDLSIGADIDAVWLRSDTDVVRIPSLEAYTGQVRNGQIFRRDKHGDLIEQIDFGSAEKVGDRWVLYDVTRHSAQTGVTTQAPSMPWAGQIDIENLPLISSGIRELPLTAIQKLIDNEGFGQQPTSLYETWYHHRLASALPPFLLICLVAGLAQRFRRSGGIGLLLVSSLGFGFAFLVFDDTSLAFGEAGFIPPWVAAWLPKLTLSLLIAYLVVRNEG